MTRKRKTKKTTTTKRNPGPTKGSKEERTERIVERVRRVLEEELDPDDVFAEIEDVALNTTNEAVRRVLEEVLKRKAAALPEEVEIDGNAWRRHQPGAGQYYSLCGTLEVQRATYRRVGVRNGPTCVALDLVVGMVGRMTPAMSASVALGHAHGPMREYEKTLIAAGRRPPPRATLERLAAAAGDAAIEAIDQSEPLIRAGEALPDGAHALCVGLDRTTTPMEEQLPRERAKRPRKRRKPRIRRPPPPAEVNYRMAYVGVVNIVDEDRNTLLCRRYAATPSDGPQEILQRMRADIEHFRQLDPKLPVLAIQDGAHELWNLVRPMLDDVVGSNQWHELIDWYHAVEHITAAARLLEKEPQEQQRRRVELERTLKRNRKGAAWVYAQLHAASLQHSCRSDKGKELSRHAGYFIDECRMNYRRHLHRRWPIGSGALEGACKSLICARTKRSGQRWHKEGLKRVLTLRGLEQSDRLAPLWRHVCERHRPPVTIASRN